MDELAVLIPCYNESTTIGKVIRDFKRALPKAVIYVYDNNSNDGTDEIARMEGAVVRYEKKQGKGEVIRTMFREIDAQCYLMVDGDDTYPAEDARKMADLVLDKGIDMVIGDRLSSTYFEENKRLFHNLGNKVVRKLINLLFANNIRDILTGYRAFSYRFAKTFPVLSKGFEIETEMTIHALDKNMHLENVIISYKDRPQGSISKLNTFSDGIKVLKMVARLYKHYRPFSFYRIIAVILFLLSVAFFVPVLGEYFKTGLVERFPTLIICGFLVVASLQSYFSGLILNVISTNQRQQFELSLNQFEGYKTMQEKGDHEKAENPV
ncbi:MULTISPECIES: glycosyltransferase family 2 protein [Robinsoniella]|uniref:Putative glucosyl-3-phosphoglycerate synthase n=1 Tax=Robinsoniella peoriensis TaxID=180332 RepID=A0A4V6HRQ3_9FIRM|nr:MULTISPECIES: glycosyltransferase family 2 protein [Robinsoniella]MDU7029151.1 glycosyltransferase family 2 protein [Clostridiales bacterium]TLC99907.1 putative glucosyl-3-phosphoglycerate synthase [Robinsoniella peoriensis]